METASKLDLDKHPCFSADAKHQYARLHLPVAPRCNMQCNFCNRDFSCVNESRPGITSTILQPRQALTYLNKQMARLKNLTVVGIAGPGDPFANPEETMETLRLVRESYPEMLLCVATNGLGLEPYVTQLVNLKVSHVTVTVNAVNPQIGAKIYSWMRYQKRTHTGEEAAAFLWERQKASIQALVAAGVLVKVNSICIPGINEHHLEAVAEEVAGLGAGILNVMALKPSAGTAFADVPEPDTHLVGRIRLKARQFIPQMSHCSRCRADAVGLVGEEMSMDDMQLLLESAGKSTAPVMAETDDEADASAGTGNLQPLVAVATMEGMLVNQHLGEAEKLMIYRPDAIRNELVDIRNTPEPGSGNTRWEKLAEQLSDCAVLLVSGIGPGPRAVFEGKGIRVEVVEGLISDALKRLSDGSGLGCMKKMAAFKCGASCSGSGGGCG